MATEITETERKYDAPQGAALPDLADLPQVAAESDPEEQTLRAEYYDTDDLRLIRNGITLRRRTGGNDAGWHLKLPLGGDSRSEIRLPPGRASTRSAAGGPPEAGRRPFGAGVVLARGGRGHGVRQSAGTHAAVLRPAGTAGRAGLGPPDAHRHPAAAQHAEILRPGAAP